MVITVCESKFHGGGILYAGKSENQAVKAARKDTCSHWDSACKCGGPRIIKTGDDGLTYELHCWEATKPFTQKKESFWAVCGAHDLDDAFENIECPHCEEEFEIVSHGDTECPHCGGIVGK